MGGFSLQDQVHQSEEPCHPPWASFPMMPQQTPPPVSICRPELARQPQSMPSESLLMQPMPMPPPAATAFGNQLSDFPQVPQGCDPVMFATAFATAMAQAVYQAKGGPGSLPNPSSDFWEGGPGSQQPNPSSDAWEVQHHQALSSSSWERETGLHFKQSGVHFKRTESPHAGLKQIKKQRVSEFNNRSSDTDSTVECDDDMLSELSDEVFDALCGDAAIA